MVLKDVGGSIDGSNKNFTTPTGYESGTLRVWENGRLLQSELDNGFDETGIDTFRTKVAPPFGTSLKCMYKEA